MAGFKKIAKLLVAAALAGAFVFSAAACTSTTSNPDSGLVEEVDRNRTQLYVGNFNRGYGDEWILTLKERFEEFYKDKEFEPGTGKKGVQVMVDNLQDAGTTYINSMKNSRNAVIFNELVYYNDYVNQGLVAPIDDVVKGDLSVYGDTGTIEDKMYDQHKKFYKSIDGHYYGIPHYTSFTGIIYDVDMFENAGLYFAYDEENSMDGFIIDKTDRRSAGPDGKLCEVCAANGYNYSAHNCDDGLPATYDEYFRLCDYIDAMGDMATIWTGSYRSEYLGYLLRSLAVDYEGMDQILLNYDFSGTATNLVDSIDADGTVHKRAATPIQNSNGYELYTSAGRYYALDFLHRLIFNEEGKSSGYWYPNSFTGGMSQLEAQDLYLTSVYENERIAMLFDGIWWENEAKDTFRDMSVGDSSMSRENRRFGFMPFPKAEAKDVGVKKNTMMDTLYSMAFINANCMDDPVTYDLAKKFLMFAYTQESLEEFTMITSAPKSLKYEISSENQKKMSYFGRSVWNNYKNSDVVYPISTNSLYLNNQSSFEYASTFRTEVNDVVYTDIGSAMYNNGFTAKQMFEGIAAVNSKTNWENTYKDYFEKDAKTSVLS